MNKHKLTFLLAGALMLFTSMVYGQQDKSKRASPPAKASATTNEGVNITVDYSSPSVKGREIWGTKIAEHDKVWRTGANEATTFTVDKDVMIEGKKLPKGTYALFTIVPSKGDDITLIFNKVANQWGAYDYKESEDALRVKVKSKKVDDVQEKLKFDVQKNGTVDFAWEKLRFSFDVKPA